MLGKRPPLTLCRKSLTCGNISASSGGLYLWQMYMAEGTSQYVILDRGWKKKKTNQKKIAGSRVPSVRAQVMRCHNHIEMGLGFSGLKMILDRWQ
jgi:hypothetical protein